MDFTIHVWRQKNQQTVGKLESYRANNISADMSFIEMLNEVNRQLIEKGEEPFEFECDCLEGICGTCSLTINGKPHGPEGGTTTCQLHMRSFADGEEITVEPFRSEAFPIIRDLVVDRAALDKIIQAGGFVSVNTGGAPDGNMHLISKEDANQAMDAAACIGCGACVAACKNSSAMLFTAAKVSHLAILPQGNPERFKRVLEMVAAMDQAGFGNCSNQEECEAACPKEISVKFISKLNREFLKASIRG